MLCSRDLWHQNEGSHSKQCSYPDWDSNHKQSSKVIPWDCTQKSILHIIKKMACYPRIPRKTSIHSRTICKNKYIFFEISLDTCSLLTRWSIMQESKDKEVSQRKPGSIWDMRSIRFSLDMLYLHWSMKHTSHGILGSWIDSSERSVHLASPWCFPRSVICFTSFAIITFVWWCQQSMWSYVSLLQLAIGCVRHTSWQFKPADVFLIVSELYERSAEPCRNCCEGWHRNFMLIQLLTMQYTHALASWYRILRCYDHVAVKDRLSQYLQHITVSLSPDCNSWQCTVSLLRELSVILHIGLSWVFSSCPYEKHIQHPIAPTWWYR